MSPMRTETCGRKQNSIRVLTDCKTKSVVLMEALPCHICDTQQDACCENQ